MCDLERVDEDVGVGMVLVDEEDVFWYSPWEYGGIYV